MKRSEREIKLFKKESPILRKRVLALGRMLPAEMDALEEHFELIKLWQEKDPEHVIQTHKNDIIYILSAYNGMQVTRRLIESFPNLGLIAQFGVGFDNIDLQAAKEREIPVTNSPGPITMSDTADVALLLTLSCARRAMESDMYVRVGKWLNGPFPLGVSLSGKVAGIVGMGRIGQEIAKRCEAFGMRVVYNGPNEKKEQPYDYFPDLKDMAKEVDFLILSCAGGIHTRNMVNGDVLRALGPKGYLINVSRGTVLNEEDFLIALNNKEIAGGGLDVYDSEPDVPSDLLSLDNVVLLPHIGGGTFEARTEMGQIVVDNILAHYEGKPLLTPVD